MSKIVATIKLSDDERNYPASLVKTRTIQAQIVDRALLKRKCMMSFWFTNRSKVYSVR